MNHTPGPWSLGVVNQGVAFVNADGGVCICKCDDSDGDVDPKANAILIAAAPELLATCQIAVDLIEEYVQGRPEVAKQMRAAIAKAIIG